MKDVDFARYRTDDAYRGAGRFLKTAEARSTTDNDRDERRRLCPISKAYTVQTRFIVALVVS